MIICKRSTITALVVGLLITVCLPLPAQNEAGPSAATVSTATQVDLESEKAGKIDWGEQIMKGEEIAFVLIFAAVAGLAFFRERLYSVRRRHFVPGKRAEELIGIWQSGDFERAWMRAQKDPSIFGRAAEYIAGHTHLSFEIVSFRLPISSRGRSVANSSAPTPWLSWPRCRRCSSCWARLSG